MNKPTLLFISMGELATHLLEAVARTEIFGTIVVSSRNLEKAQKRTNNAVLGAGD
jgi:pyrroline-5-carboxylate reductase